MPERSPLASRILAATLIFCTLSVLPDGAVAANNTISGTASVIDGDTIEIHGARIRLHAIDAVEGRQRCRLPDGSVWRCGRDASFALANRIGRAPVTCEIRDIDRYGRYVGVCFQKGEDLNDWMVRNGWALAYRRYGMDYVRAEKEARAAAIGIWASEFIAPWDWRHQ